MFPDVLCWTALCVSADINVYKADTGQTVYMGNYKNGSASVCTLMCAMDVHASICILDFGTFSYTKTIIVSHPCSPVVRDTPAR